MEDWFIETRIPAVFIQLSPSHCISAAECSLLECESCERQLYFSKAWVEVGGLLHSAFFISGSTFFFIPSMCFCCIICRLKQKHNLPCSVDLECEYGKHMALLKATVLLLLSGHILSEGCTDGTWRSEWLASAAAGAGNFTCRKAKRGRHQQWATAEELVEMNTTVKLSANKPQKFSFETFS